MVQNSLAPPKKLGKFCAAVALRAGGFYFVRDTWGGWSPVRGGLCEVEGGRGGVKGCEEAVSGVPQG